MSLVGALLGWWASVAHPSTMTHYRALSHDALMTELAQTNDGQVSTSSMSGLFLVIAIVLLVDVLSRYFDAVWLRIELPRR